MDASTDGAVMYSDANNWKLETALLWDFLRHRLLVGIIFGLFLFGLILYGLLRSMPRAYTATVSVSLQGSRNISSPLGTLLGGASPSSAYMGVLKSRRMAREVARSTHLQEVLSLPSEEEAIGKLTNGLKAEDVPADGLMYINMTLNAPPRLSGDNAQVKKIQQAAALAANAYPKALLRYMQDSDTDKDLSLLRAAEGEVRRVRQDYNDATYNVLLYVKKHPVSDRETAPAASDSSGISGTNARGEGSGIASALQALYQRRGQLEQERAYTSTLRSGSLELLHGDPATLPDLPGVTALADARRDYNDALANYHDLQIQYSELNPNVVASLARVRLAEKRVMAQVQAIRAGRVADSAQRAAAAAELEIVDRQIQNAEHALQTSRETDQEYGRLKRELDLRFEALKQALSQFASLSLQTVSAQNRLNIIDEALPPTASKPALPLLILASAAGAVLSATACLLVEFFLRRRGRRGRI